MLISRKMFLIAIEIFAQEEAYICLQLPMKRSSWQTVFVNTSPLSQRVTLLKSQQILEQMDEEYDNIECIQNAQSHWRM